MQFTSSTSPTRTLLLVLECTMPRIMMVRHAQSAQNAYMETLMVKMGKGDIDADAFNRGMRDGPAGTAAGDDSSLSVLGVSQADCLGRSWAPLLLEKAKLGKLITFVSPFLRTLQTADPLLSEICRQVPGYKAVILPAIMEAGGLTAQVWLTCSILA